jgi:hypothetical protein
MLEDGEIEEILRGAAEPAAAVRALVNAALQNGGRDNICIIFLRQEEQERIVRMNLQSNALRSEFRDSCPSFGKKLGLAFTACLLAVILVACGAADESVETIADAVVRNSI